MGHTQGIGSLVAKSAEGMQIFFFNGGGRGGGIQCGKELEVGLRKR